MKELLESLFTGDSSDNDENAEFMPLFSFDNSDEEEDDKFGKGNDTPDNLPLVPLKNTVLFPGVVVPITIGREKSIKAINKANKGSKLVAVFTQRDENAENPQTMSDVYKIGTLARVLKVIKMPDGGTTALLQGRKRITLLKITETSPFLEASVSILAEKPAKNKKEFPAIISSIRDMAERIVELSPNIPNEATNVLRNMTSDMALLNFVASNMNAELTFKQQVLEEHNIGKKAEMVLTQLSTEIQLLELKEKIENKVRVELDKQQRDYYLNQQIKQIQEEIGGGSEENEIENLVKKADAKVWSKEVRQVFDRELARLRRTPSMVPDHGIILNYLELLTDLPWGEYTKDSFDIKNAEKILNEDHTGLEKVKKRILEHLSVLKMKGDLRAPILCLVGPPGVGKTSLGRSIAKALGRSYVRMSLGGLHDESEIRGHRKTYIGAMPGRILQNLKKAKSSNPVFILDELDKLGTDFRGDPSSALLEVLDPEQNTTFHDNYLDVDFDLSKVLFIATANSLNKVQSALLDRMEIIEVEGYSIEEKIEIAAKHIVPKQLEAHGLDKKQAKFSKAVLTKIAEDYTQESGVREMERQVAAVMRAVAKKIASEEKYDPAISVDEVVEILGRARYNADIYKEDLPAGVAVGLAWTRVGGDILFIETNLTKGEGKLTLTGNLGDVMKESATTALSYLRANCEAFDLDHDVFKTHNVHIHIPAGATPKDGPSAGITMLSALASVFTQRPLKKHLAMTGEITLRGKVLPVGGIREKILAAKRAGITEIILCEENEKDIAEIKPEYIKGMSFHYVKAMHQVLDLALTKAAK